MNQAIITAIIISIGVLIRMSFQGVFTKSILRIFSPRLLKPPKIVQQTNTIITTVASIMVVMSIGIDSTLSIIKFFPLKVFPFNLNYFIVAIYLFVGAAIVHIAWGANLWRISLIRQFKRSQATLPFHLVWMLATIKNISHNYSIFFQQINNLVMTINNTSMPLIHVRQVSFCLALTMLFLQFIYSI